MTAGVASRLPDLDARLRGLTLDQALVALTAATTWWLAPSASPVAVPAAAALVVLVLGACDGATGRTPGRLLARTVLVDHRSGRPPGAGRGVLRTTCLTLAGLPTAGLAWALLALGAATDPAGGRRGWHDRWFGTRVRGVGGALPPSPTVSEPPSVNLMALRLGQTVERVEVPHPRTGSGPVLPQRWQVECDRGETFDVVDRLVVGRRPAAAADAPAEPGWARLVSADGSLSATHAELAALPDGSLVLRDRGSRNGTLLVRGGAARTLTPGRPTTVLPGDRIRVGDRWMRVCGRSDHDTVVEPSGPAPSQVLPLP
ncbi:FHA domain-containing protein [Nocardioides daphniae]|uniref:FHA domain-containing protein n=1 Tax=Nocardioides daphniae TaxID=402297 RepID=A0A4P7UCV3_9ACTN|nr:FHA domain-containing protein [Nocardioides daphniae]QCC78030.1 FHA domain-containing protein [Nocardioides daphniae]GGD22891.1 hypothetical protein GCM10007231_22450 [Nocardioides daphniae]